MWLVVKFGIEIFIYFCQRFSQKRGVKLETEWRKQNFKIFKIKMSASILCRICCRIEQFSNFVSYRILVNRKEECSYMLFEFLILSGQGVTKRCRQSWLTKSALVYDPKCGGGVAGPRPMSKACTMHMEPNKLWRSISIFNLFYCISGTLYTLIFNEGFQTCRSVK